MSDSDSPNMEKEKKRDKKEKKKEKRRRELEEEAERKRRKAERKSRDKAGETEEERNARRMAKKLAKQAKQKQEKELFGYTNEANPFNDPNLTKAFVWKKKYDKEKATGIFDGKATGTRAQPLTKGQLKEKQVKLRHEIEKVKARREAREEEKAQMELMREQMEKEAIIDAVEGWEEREEEFFREQAHKSSEIRINEGREKAIDILAKNLKLSMEDKTDANLPVDLDVELTEPHLIFNGLGKRDLEELAKDLKVRAQLGGDELYWKALITICDDEMYKARNGGSGAYGLQEAVYEEIVGLLEGKHYKELQALENDVNRRISVGSRDSGVDVVYWENLLKHLQIFKAKAHLTDFHKALLKKRLKQLKQAHFEESDSDDNEKAEGGEDWEPELIPHSALTAEEKEKAKAAGKKDDEDSDDGNFSPVLLQDVDAEALEEAIDPEQDKKELEARRRVILEAKESEIRAAKMQEIAEQKAALESEEVERTLGTKRFMMSSEDMYQREAEKDMEDGEQVFKSELATPDQTYWWHDKYRPRKPRYFNRVKTGFEWNKYNQTHYDKENPPPKIVQGYKFNVFYPDLIDVNKPPRYFIEEDPASKDHCTIRFTAGPPYEDVAFKIVRKEWEFSHKRGFKCVFDRGVLHLYFNFRRYRYRR